MGVADVYSVFPIVPKADVVEVRCLLRLTRDQYQAATDRDTLIDTMLDNFRNSMDVALSSEIERRGWVAQ